MRVRVGQGFDIHRFTDDPDRPLILGGVLYPNERGLEGHSDGTPSPARCPPRRCGTR
jgi:2-C-methyl-D-erythritol 2,4-cyclodiphosphate synthase